MLNTERFGPIVLIAAALILAAAVCNSTVKAKHAAQPIARIHHTSHALAITTIDIATGEVIAKAASPMNDSDLAWSLSENMPTGDILTVTYFKANARFVAKLWREVQTKSGTKPHQVAAWCQSSSLGYTIRIDNFTILIDLEVNR